MFLTSEIWSKSISIFQIEKENYFSQI